MNTKIVILYSIADQPTTRAFSVKISHSTPGASKEKNRELESKEKCQHITHWNSHACLLQAKLPVLEHFSSSNKLDRHKYFVHSGYRVEIQGVNVLEVVLVARPILADSVQDRQRSAGY